MAEVKIEEIINHLDSDIRRALEDAVRENFPDAHVDAWALFRSFVRAVGRKCRTWERVPDQYVKK